MIPSNTCQYQKPNCTDRDNQFSCRLIRQAVVSRLCTPQPVTMYLRGSQDITNEALFDYAKLHLLALKVWAKNKQRVSVPNLMQAKVGFAFPQLQQDFLMTHGIAAPSNNGRVLIFGNPL
jgi:hypothetical protein